MGHYFYFLFIYMFEAGRAESKQTQDPTETVFLTALQVLPVALMNSASQEPDGQQNCKQGKSRQTAGLAAAGYVKKIKKIKFHEKNE